jgi:signal transduction histidine kinase
VQYGISRVLAEAASLPEAAPKILKAVCEAAVWELGSIWRVDSAEGVLRCVECWHLPSMAFPEFERVSRTRTFSKGIGVPGRIWASAQPVWVKDVTKDNNFPRAAVATEEGFHAAFGFPILLNNQVVGVIEFFSCEVREPDDNFLSMIGVVGSQIGQFIERKESEAALRAAKEQLTSYANELEERVARRTARLNDTVDSLQSFSYSIAHDLRAPVRAMAGFATILKEQYAANLDAEAQSYIGRIIDGASRMDRLIMDLLAYGQVAHMDVPRSVIPLGDVIRDAREQLADEITGAGANIQAPDALPAVKGHRAVLCQVFVNLIANSLKFVERGVKPRIVISAESQGTTVRVRLCDNGIGIDPALHDRIFNVFERGPATSGLPGTGIGLAIARKGVERLGGRIGIEPAPEGGSCFWIELPAA